MVVPAGQELEPLQAPGALVGCLPRVHPRVRHQLLLLPEPVATLIALKTVLVLTHVLVVLWLYNVYAYT